MSSVTDQQAQKPYAYIYCLSDPRTGEVRYVGKTFDLKRRISCHRHCYDHNHRGYWLRTLKAEGLQPKMEVLEEIIEQSDLAWEEAERFWIETFRFYGVRLLNSESGGVKGKRISEEHRAKISAAHRTPEVAAIRLATHLGRRKNPGPGDRIIAIKTVPKRLGRKWSAWQIAFHKPMLGRKHSEETKQKLRIANLGRKFSAEVRNKVRLSMLGRKVSEETKKKISAANKGRKWTAEMLVSNKTSLGMKLSEETKNKMSVARKLFWSRRASTQLAFAAF